MLSTTLRKKSSLRDLFRGRVNDDGHSSRPDTPPASVTPDERADPSSSSFSQPPPAATAAQQRPPSRAPSRAPSRPDDSRPASSHRPMTPSDIRRRFSMMRFRHASDPQLSSSYKSAALRDSPPPNAAPAPVIGITAPTFDITTDQPEVRKPKRKLNPFGTRQQSFRSKSYNQQPKRSMDTTRSKKARPSLHKFQTTDPNRLRPSPRPSTGSYDPSSAPRNEHSFDLNSSLDVPASLARTSDSSASDFVTNGVATNGDSSRTNTMSKASNFFTLPRRKKKKAPESLFPLPIKLSPPEQPPPSTTLQPESDDIAIVSAPNSGNHLPLPESPSRAIRKDAIENKNSMERPLRTAPVNSSGSVSFAPPSGALFRHGSQASSSSAPSPAGMASPVGKAYRARSGTNSSYQARHEGDTHLPVHGAESPRNSTASTTLGRNSIAGLRSLTSRFRHPSDSSPRHGSPGGTFVATSGKSSNNNSFALSRETLVVPDREEGETSGRYYSRLEKEIPKKNIAMVLSKRADPFSSEVLRSLMRTFKFYEEPIDIAIRRFLWEIDLPGEAQQIDRVISAFAERYHECNPHIFNNQDDAYLVAYSIIILHSDLFNKNNKRKMQRPEYQKNTSGHGVHDEILGYFYDNIQYTEFIARDPDEAINEGKSKNTLRKQNKKRAKSAGEEAVTTGKLDPYDFIVDPKAKLEILRPALRDVMNLDDTYNYTGTVGQLDTRKALSSFAKHSKLQVISARSRPEAFMSPGTIDNPAEATVGVVDIKVAKVGTLWRKDPRKRKTRSPWQEWGAILTMSKLYFFRDDGWVKGLRNQHDHFWKHKSKKHPGGCLFKPPLEEFKADFAVPTFHAVALLDANYKRHKHAFVLARLDDHMEEVLLAEDEHELNDWIAKLNYAATFISTNTQMRLDPKLRREDTDKMGLVHTDTDHSFKSETAVSMHSPTNGDSTISPTDTSKNETPLDVAKRDALIRKIEVLSDGLNESNQKSEDLLKVARHLEILAPFPSKTRGDLLTFGARMAHKIRWSRYECWRLKCHRDVLVKELQEQEHQRLGLAPPDPGVGSGRSPSPMLASKPSALSRFNSKANAFISPRAAKDKLGRASPRIYPKSDPSASQEEMLSSGIDQAFATPTETLSQQSLVGGEGVWRLPPLDLEAPTPKAAQFSKPLPPDPEPPVSPGLESVARDSICSRHSKTSASEVEVVSDAGATPTASIKEQEGDLNADANNDKRPSTAVEASDKEEKPPLATSSPSSRAKARRSLQRRTLRESRDLNGLGHHRSRRGKESSSTAGGDDASGEGDNLQRGKGPFTVHGKKASVITFGSEWQKMSAEERLKARKEAQKGSTAGTNTDGSERGSISASAGGGSIAFEPTPRTSAGSLALLTPGTERTNRTSYYSVADSLPSFNTEQEAAVLAGATSDVGSLPLASESEAEGEAEGDGKLRLSVPRWEAKTPVAAKSLDGTKAPATSTEPTTEEDDDEEREVEGGFMTVRRVPTEERSRPHSSSNA